MEHRIALIDMDTFFASVERTLDPGLEGRPVIVGGARSARGVVACASYEARAYGVRAGTPLARAARLCPHAAFLTGNAKAYCRAHLDMVEVVSRFSPAVEPYSIDEAYIDLTGSQRLFGPAARIALEIQRRIAEELGLPCSIGVAGAKLAAKVASKKAKPAGVLVVPPGAEAEFLAPLGIRELPGVGPRTTAKLLGMGIKTVGEMAVIGPEALRKRFGIVGLALHAAASGRDPSEVRSLIEEPPPPKSMSRSVTFHRDIWDEDKLLAVLFEMAVELGGALRAEARLARKTEVTIRFSDFHTITRGASLRDPTNQDVELFRAAAELFSRCRTERPLCIRLVGLAVSRLGPDCGQMPVFDADRRQRRRSLYRVMDAINGRFGPGTASVGRWSESPLAGGRSIPPGALQQELRRLAD